MLDQRVVDGPGPRMTSDEDGQSPDVPGFTVARAELGRALGEWERMRGRPVVVYVADEQALPVKAVDDADVVPLYDCLCSTGDARQLDLVIGTTGGKISSARKVAHLVRKFAQEITAVVPCQARSAGTLLCLACDRILFGPLGELGPLDAQLTAAAEGNAYPFSLSSADIRGFREMAQQWFAVDDGLEAIRILSGRVFPPTLSSFYRAEQYVRTVAAEMLKARDPEAGLEAPEIIDRLVAGYHAHDHAIFAADARHLGLRADESAGHETTALMRLWRAVRVVLASSSQAACGGSPRVPSALIASSAYMARHWQPTLDAFAAGTRDAQPHPALLAGGWDA